MYTIYMYIYVGKTLLVVSLFHKAREMVGGGTKIYIALVGSQAFVGRALMGRTLMAQALMAWALVGRAPPELLRAWPFWAGPLWASPF